MPPAPRSPALWPRAGPAAFTSTPRPPLRSARPPRGPALLSLLLAILLAPLAAACNVCTGREDFSGPASAVELPASGDLAACACVFVFEYSEGPTLGRLRIDATPALGTVVVYDSTDASAAPVAEYAPADMLQGATLYSKTGVLRVAIATAEAAELPAEASLSLVVAAVNQGPEITRIGDYEEITFNLGMQIPWSPNGIPLPVMVRDYDNWNRALRAEVSLTPSASGILSTALRFPAVVGVDFVVGEPLSLVDRVVLEGPGDAVEAALNNALLVTIFLGAGVDNLSVVVSDEAEESLYSEVVAVFPSGEIDVPRGEDLVQSGSSAPDNGYEAQFFVHDAYEISMTSLGLSIYESDGSCINFYRVWDGPDTATGRLLSTELYPTGEVCGFYSQFLPSYIGSTGEFVFEVVTQIPEGSVFETEISWTPVGFRAWFLGDVDTLDVASDDPLPLPRVMVTSLPDTTSVVVTVAASAGAVSLRFADSFVDVVQPATEGALALEVTSADPAVHAMLRMGDALREVQYVPPAGGLSAPATVTVTAISGGAEAIAELIIEPATIAINMPVALSVRAFQPVAIPVAMSAGAGATGALTAEVVTASGIGQMSVDPRAGVWVDIGYGTSLTLSGTADEVASALALLVYKATEGGGEDSVTVTVGAASRTTVLSVNPECQGVHHVYGRSTTVTERAGPPPDPYSPDASCVWHLYGARELTVPYFEVPYLQSAFIVQSIFGTQLYLNLFRPPGTLRAGTEAAYLRISLEAAGVTGQGFVAVSSEQAGINDPPVIVVPFDTQRVVRGSTTPLRTLYVDDFADGPIVASLETDAGWLGTEGTRVLSVEAESFAELDDWVTGIDFLAGDEQATATLVLTATDAEGATASESFDIEVLPCSGVVDVALADGSSSVAVGDGSGSADYSIGLDCGWRLTGAPAPAVLAVEVLDLDCSGDLVTVYDGASSAGRPLGSFCQAGEVAEAVGTLTSSTGSFFVSLTTNTDELVDDGFAFVYAGLESGLTTPLGLVPAAVDPERAAPAVAALDTSTVAVFGGHNGVRTVSSTLAYRVGDGWKALSRVGEGPSGRWRVAGAALDATHMLVHGGRNVEGNVLDETWIADIDFDASLVSWTSAPEAGGPRTDDSALHVHGGVAHLIDDSGVHVLSTGAAPSWSLTGSTPSGVLPTTSAYRAADGHVYAAGTDGALWQLALSAAAWTRLDLPTPMSTSGCEAWVCSGAFLGTDEYVAITDDGSSERVNVTSLSRDTLETAASGTAVSGTYLGQPAMFVYGDGAMAAVALTLGVSSIVPQVSPTTGGTAVTVSGERLSSCDAAHCAVNDQLSVALVNDDRTAICTTPAAAAGVAGTVDVALTCGDGRQYTTTTPLAYFGEPRIEALDPVEPEPGATVLVTLGGVSEEVLGLVSMPLCRIGPSTGESEGLTKTMEGSLDGPILRCSVPESLAMGSQGKLEVSLDGQQFGSTTEFSLASPTTTSSSSSSSLLVIVVSLASAAVVLLFVVLRYRRLASMRVVAGPAAWEISFESLELTKAIAAGAYGTVYKGQFRGGTVAIKVTKAAELSPEIIESFRKESALMAELRHPNIVLFMGACTKPPDIAIVLEFLPNGSLFDLIHDEEVILGMAERLNFARDIVRGMAYLHAAEPPIVHRDLKSLNVLVDKSWTLKVSDFGLTEVFAEKPDENQSQEAAGSLYWMAPEVVRGQGAERPSDVYSFAITLWEIATRSIPHEGLPPVAVMLKIKSNADFRPMSEEPLGNPFDSMITRCWATDPERRPTFADLQGEFSELLQADDDRRSLSAGHSPLLSGKSVTMSPMSQSGMQLSLTSDASMPGSDQACVVALRPAGSADIWNADPIRGRQLMEDFHCDVQRLCTEQRGTSMLCDTKMVVCVFGSVADGVRFAATVQVCKWSGDDGLWIAGGLAQGRIDTQRDGHGRLSNGGPGVVQAQELAHRAAGGQVLSSPATVDGLEIATLGAVQIEAGDNVALYPVALQDRHEAIAGGSSVVQGGTSQEPSWIIPISELDIGPLIGAGSFGTVHRAFWRGTPVAAKQLHRKTLNTKETLDLQMEGGVASKLRHPNICQFLGICNGDKIYVVSELMAKGSVFDSIVTTRKEISVEVKTRVMRDIARGLRYLHEQSPPVVHRSLTARNVLLAPGWVAKVSDFGLARVKNGAATMTKIGSTAYSAPEVLRGEKYDEMVDVYAFGILQWEVVAQKVAWGGERLGALAQKVLDGKRPAIDANWPAEMVKVMEATWIGEAQKRAKMADVVDML